MKDQTPNAYALHQGTSRSLFVCGLWIRIGFLGACGVLAGLLQLFDGDSTAGAALAVLVGGAVLGAISWWRLRAVLALLDRAEAWASETSLPVNAARVDCAPRAASMQAIAR